MTQNLVFVLAVLFSTGCAIKVTMPVNRMEPPETSGKSKIKINAGIGGSNVAVLTSDHTVTPPNTSNPTYEKGSHFHFGVGYGVSDAFELQIRSDRLVNLKVQLLGEPRSTAKAGNFSFALTAGAGYSDTSKTGSHISGSSATTKLSDYILDGAVILGYRFEPFLMVYGGGFVSRKNYSGTHSSGSTLNFSGYAENVGGNAGLEVGSSSFQARIEGAYANMKSGSINTGRIFVGGEAAFTF